NRSPDYFASVEMGKHKSGEYVILDAVRTNLTFGEWFEFILDNARNDGPHVEIILPIDPSPAAKASTTLLARVIIDSAFIAKTNRSTAGKLDFFRPFAASSDLSIVKVAKGCANDVWNKIQNDNDFMYQELERCD